MFIEDKQYEATMYVIPILNNDYLIALGKSRTEYANIPHNVVYYPIYLLNKDKKLHARIGVYEIQSQKVSQVIDKDGDVNLNKFTEPLLFSFVDETYLADKVYDDNLSADTLTNSMSTESETDEGIEKDTELKKNDNEDIDVAKEEKDNANDNKEDDDEKNTQEEEENEDKDSPFSITPIETDKENSNSNTNKLLLKDDVLKHSTEKDEMKVAEEAPFMVETKEMADSIRKEYEYKQNEETDNWLMKLMKNKHYQIHTNPGAGDCFFFAVQDAYKSIGYDTEVSLLRKYLAQYITKDSFDNYKLLYTSYAQEVTILEEKQQKFHAKSIILKKHSEKNTDIEKEKEFTKKGEFIREAIEKNNHQLNEVRSLLHNVEFMKSIDSLQQLRDFVQSSSYYIDEGTIPLLERNLAIKSIIMVETTDIKTLIQCGEVLDGFQPDFYILLHLDQKAQHYELVSYKDKKIFTFSELPFDLKKQTIDTCFLSGKKIPEGGYYNIDEFKRFYHNIYGNTVDNNITDDDDNDDNNNNNNNNNNKYDEDKYVEEEEEEVKNDLYDEHISLIFHSKSDKNKTPGNVCGDDIPVSKITQYMELGSIKNKKLAYPLWRRRLDDSWIKCDSDEELCNGDELAAPFITKDGKRWASVAHYMLALQYESNDKSIYDELSLDSKSEISEDLNKADKRLKKQKSKPMDKDIKEAFRKEALRAKFKNNLDLKKILLLTKNAKLLHYSRKEVKPDISLMEIRREIAQELGIRNSN